MGTHLHLHRDYFNSNRYRLKGGNFMKTEIIAKNYMQTTNKVVSEEKIRLISKYEEYLLELGAGEIRDEKVLKYLTLTPKEIKIRTQKMLKKTLVKRLITAAESKPVYMYQYNIYTKLAQMEIFLNKEEIQKLISLDKTHALEYNRAMIKKYL